MLKKIKVFVAIATAVSLLSGVVALAAPGESFFSEPPPLSFEPDDDSWLGYKIVPKVDITITALGRDATDMAQDHPVRLWDVSARPDPLGEWGEDEPQRTAFEGSYIMSEVLITPDSLQDKGFHYEELEEPIVLKAGGLYAIVALEYAEGDYMVWPTDVTDVISGLINENIANITEDAHSGPQHGRNDIDAPPVNYWISTWTYGEETMGRWDGNAGVMSNVNFWYTADAEIPAAEETEEVEEAVIDEEIEEIDDASVVEEVIEKPVEADKVVDDKPVPVNGDRLVGNSAYIIILTFMAFGAVLLSIRKRRENN